MKDLIIKADELGRRQFIAHTAKTFLGVTVFTPLLARAALPPKGNQWDNDPKKKSAGGTPMRKPTARNVIFLYMSGGMTHLDTFDPKSGEVAGPVKPLETNVDGIQLSQYLPALAKKMDKISLVRSLSTTQGAHEQGNYYMHTSYTMRGTIAHPGLGAWIQRHEGRTNRTLPGSVRIGGGAAGGGAGFMESRYAPLVLGSANEGVKNSRMTVSEKEFNDRLMLAQQFDESFHQKYNQKNVRAYKDMYDDALRLMRSEDLKAFNIGMEPSAVREAYGNNGFGQGCLLARRLVENDVRFVEVTLGGWDTHANNFTSVERLTASLDQALSTLLTDLDRRGLLEETVVALCTEFGRTPVINEDDGRDHFPKAFSGLLAGGGIRGGYAYGKTDERGDNVIEGKIRPEDFNATIAYALGLPLDQIVYSPSKRPFTVADKGRPITELFA
ncbi:MAG: DUF1501 domain-containing protein [Verrucomicrobiales bacterium]